MCKFLRFVESNGAYNFLFEGGMTVWHASWLYKRCTMKSKASGIQWKSVFRACAAAVLSPSETEQAISAVLSLGELSNARELGMLVSGTG